MFLTDQTIIQQTTNWIKTVVIGLNFCPFAAKPLLKKTIHYSVMRQPGIKENLEILEKEFRKLDQDEEIETTLVIFPETFTSFLDYLKLVKKAEAFLIKSGYEGIYQLASFHPEYCFAGSEQDDPANFTNRSIYPMLHILREESLTKALTVFKNPESIPERNIEIAKEKGLQYMKILRNSCM